MLARLDHELEGSQAHELSKIYAHNGVTPAALESSLVARDLLGRINDVIHALAITIALPAILESDEILKRPSLAAGNDPSRPFDIETDRRIAEFKLARWDGHDAARMRQLVKDLVHLAADDSGRRAELYVLDERPRHFLRTSGSTMAWALAASQRPRTCSRAASATSTSPSRASAPSPLHMSRSSTCDLSSAR